MISKCSVPDIFYDDYNKASQKYTDYITMVWDEALVICMEDTNASIGFFDKSDLIIHYDKHTLLPSCITERIWQKNYNIFKWHKLWRTLNNNVRLMKIELDFNLSCTKGFMRNQGIYIDYCHAKDEFLEWAKKYH